MNKRTKATSIPYKVKQAVYERDNGMCIFCGHSGLPEAHCISRSRGGLGIEQNIVTVCRDCHRRMDSTTDRAEYLSRAKAYLDMLYPGFADNDRIYKKRSRKCIQRF